MRMASFLRRKVLLAEDVQNSPIILVEGRGGA